MPSSYTPLGFELQAAGENLNTWGDTKLNNTLKRINFAISSYLSIALTGDTTLTSSTSSTSATDFQAFNHFLKFTGTLAVAATITVPGVGMRWSVWNAATKAITFTTGSGATAVIQSGEIVTVACNGTDCVRVQGTDFGSTRITSVADPTGAQDACTKNYADNLAFTANAGILPGQGGSAGFFLTTNGTTASWAQLTSANLSDTAARDAAALARTVAMAAAL